MSMDNELGLFGGHEVRSLYAGGVGGNDLGVRWVCPRV